MSDDEETYQNREEEEERAASPAPAPQPPPPMAEGGKSEAELMMEEKRKKDAVKQEAELEEYYEMRKEEKERIENEIADLKEKRAQRLQEREEEERVMAEQRNQLEEQRRADEAERSRKKNEEADRKRADREQKQAEAEERAKNMGKKNFVIQRKNKDGDVETVGEGDGEHKEIKKSPEQLEAEKRAAIEQRVSPLGDVKSMDLDQLKAKAKELHQQIMRQESDKYDLDQTYKQRQYEMNELAERARSMNKGGHSKGKKTVSSENDPLAEKYSGIPPKILLCSKYERHTDRRTYVERKDVFSGPIYGEEVARILPGQGQGHAGEEDGETAEAEAE